MLHVWTEPCSLANGLQSPLDHAWINSCGKLPDRNLFRWVSQICLTRESCWPAFSGKLFRCCCSWVLEKKCHHTFISLVSSSHINDQDTRQRARCREKRIERDPFRRVVLFLLQEAHWFSEGIRCLPFKVIKAASPGRALRPVRMRWPRLALFSVMGRPALRFHVLEIWKGSEECLGEGGCGGRWQ